MATSEFTNGDGTTGFNGSDTLFRNWVQAIHDALAAGGLVQQSDSGDISNIATLTCPASTSQQRGYEVWALADSLQGSAPVFIKIQYGSGSGNANAPGLWFKIGTTHDGAGGIGGQTFAEIGPINHNALGDINKVSATASGLCIYIAAASGNTNGGLMVIGRTRDSAGAITADGFYYARGDNGHGGDFLAVPMSGSVPTSSSQPIISMSGNHTKGGTDVALIRPGIAAQGKALGVREIFGFTTADIGKHTSFTATVDGATRTLMPLSSLGGYPVSGGSPAIIFE